MSVPSTLFFSFSALLFLLFILWFLCLPLSAYSLSLFRNQHKQPQELPWLLILHDFLAPRTSSNLFSLGAYDYVGEMLKRGPNHPTQMTGREWRQEMTCQEHGSRDPPSLWRGVTGVQLSKDSQKRECLLRWHLECIKCRGTQEECEI